MPLFGTWPQQKFVPHHTLVGYFVDSPKMTLKPIIEQLVSGKEPQSASREAPSWKVVETHNKIRWPGEPFS